MIDLSNPLGTTVTKETSFPWVIISLSNKLFGISSEMVISMELLPEATDIPHSPKYMRGMIESRGKMLPLIDARVKLGYLSLADEMNQLSTLFIEFQKDTEDWMNELETCTYENRLFRLNTNPEQSEFGKWYSSYETDNFAFLHLLKKFKAPYEKLHKVAKQVIQFNKEKKYQNSHNLINQTRNNTLSEMIHLFEKASKIVREETREIMLVIEVNGKEIAMTVDTVTSVEYLKDSSIQNIPTSNTEEAKFSSKIGKRANGKENVILLDFTKIDIQGITKLIENH